MSERDVVAQKLVTKLAEENVKFMNIQEDSAFRKLVPALLQKGVDGLNLSMFGEEMRAAILDALADEYLRRGNLHDAAKAYILAGNKMKLSLVGQDFEHIGLCDNAIEAYKMA